MSEIQENVVEKVQSRTNTRISISSQKYKRDSNMDGISIARKQSSIIDQSFEHAPDASTLQIIFSTRFLMTVLAMLAVFCQYSAKLDLSINIVCMINHTATSAGKNSTINEDCPGSNTTSADGPFNWNKFLQSNLLAAFFFGYLVSEIPSGILAEKYGSRIVIGLCMVLNMIGVWHYTPAAKSSYALLFFLRLVVGFGCGGILPAVSHIWTTWAPVNERSFLSGFAMAGSQLAPMVILPMAGALCTSGFHREGWPTLFYVIGIMETLWIILWFLLYRDTPAKSWLIKAKEREYIQCNVVEDSGSSELNVPWKAILTSRPCWALFVCHTCSNWGLFTLLTETPSYMKNTMNFDIKQNGTLSAIPYIVTWVLTIISSFLADFLLKNGYVTSRTLIRKVAVAIGTFIPAVFLIGLGFITCQHRYIAIVLLAIGQGAMGVSWGAGHMVNPNDLAPLHASIVFGISNTFATIPGIVTPYVTSALTGGGATGWLSVFGITAAIMIVGGIVFVLFGSGEPERWDSNHTVSPHHKRSLSFAF